MTYRKLESYIFFMAGSKFFPAFKQKTPRIRYGRNPGRRSLITRNPLFPHTDLLGGLENLAFGPDGRGNDDLRELHFADVASAEGTHRRLERTHQILAAVVEFGLRRRGAPRVSFETICAAGASAATLHCIRNDATISDDDRVLIDAGAEIGLVSADISRTFPASGRFGAMQRRVYEWVLKAQSAAIAAIRPGVTYARVHETALKVLVDGLIDLGALKGKPRELIETGAFRPYFMHRIGHWLGMDVHDVGPYFVDGASIPLRPGMVITVEPGLYFADVPATPKALRGIGVRIEDDVLVTPKGRRVLTDVPKTVDEIESLMSDRGAWWRDLRPVTIPATKVSRKKR